MKPTLFVVAAAGLAAAIVLPVAAQEAAELEPGPGDQPAVPAADSRTQLNFRISGGVEHSFETDIDDDNGDFNVTRAQLGLGASTRLSERLGLDLNFGYGYDGYDFSGDAGLGAIDPWDDVHTFRLGARFTWSIDQQWAVFGGPILSISGESGADFGDAFTAGGLAGVSYRAGDDLTIGFGAGALSQIEDDVAVFPIVILNWRPAERWRITTTGSVGASGGGGIEVGYTFAEGWTAAIGGRYDSRRFRLDDSDDVSDEGVGEETSLPIYGRLTYRPHEGAEVSVIGGVAVGGEITLEDDDGDRIIEEDFDAAPFVGLQFSFRF